MKGNNTSLPLHSVHVDPNRAGAGERHSVRLWVLSDLQLESVPLPSAYQPQPPEFDLLVVAGDVFECDAERALQTVARLAAGKPAVFVLGNGELSEGDLDERRAAAERAARARGIMLLDDSETEVCGIGFVGGTLWTDGTAEHAARHRRTRGLIKAAAARPRTAPLVVVTYHAPHLLCLPEADRGDPDARNFVSDLSALTDAGEIALWVHGHIHGTFELTRPGGTRIVCNAAGQRFRNASFREDWIIQV